MTSQPDDGAGGLSGGVSTGGGAPATMSRTGVKAQPAVRRAGPAPVPGGEDWWSEVEAVSKTAQGSSRLVRDRLFHEKLLSALDAPLQAAHTHTHTHTHTHKHMPTHKPTGRHTHTQVINDPSF